jgi:HTH DNA binding domain
LVALWTGSYPSVTVCCVARLSEEEERAMVAAYEAWDPREQTADELADELGVAKTTLYNVLNRNGVPVKTRGGVGVSSLRREQAGDLLEMMAVKALDQMFERIRSLEDELVALRSAIDEASSLAQLRRQVADLAR